jgi:tryptophan-rich sensory protein
MSVSAWLVWRKRHKTRVSIPLVFYLLQLAVNGIWSWLFFGQRLIGAAVIDLFVLVLLVAGTLVLFMRVNRKAGLLLIPYLSWICFAAMLNVQIWRLN